VIIVLHNGRYYLDDCLQSALCGDEGICEVIAVDNHSTDGTSDLIAERFPAVQLVRNASNLGFAAGCNQGAELASGSVLVFLNQDTWAHPGWLRPLVRRLNGESKIGLTTSKVVVMSQPDRIQACGQDVHYTGLVSARGFMALNDAVTEASAVAAVSGCAFAIRRDLWQALGGFDEAFYMYYEETDLSWRAQMRGYRCLCVPQSVVYHDYRPLQSNPFRFYQSVRNRQLMLLKNWRWRTLLLLSPGLFLAEIMEWVQALSLGKAGLWAKFKANMWIMSRLPKLHRIHAKAQSGRCLLDADILEGRIHHWEPVERSVEPFIGFGVTVCNALFSLNRRIACRLCRAVGW
jgi:GT2 family glycosyltransferase